MSIKYTPNKRFSDTGERTIYQALDQLARGSALVEPETVGLNELDLTTVIPIVEALPVATAFTDVKFANQTITAGTAAELDDSFEAPADATPDAIVAVAQTRVQLLFSGYVRLVDDGLGGTTPFVSIVALNHTGSDATLSAGEAISYSVMVDTSIDQPRVPNAALTVNPQINWVNPLTNEPPDPPLSLSIGNLNLTANPKVLIPDGAIGPIELSSSTIKQLASLYTGKRATFTVPGTKTIAFGNAVVIGVVNFTGSVGPRIAIGQPGTGPIFTGHVSSTNGVTTVTIEARNNATSTTQKVTAGTQLKVIAF